MTRTVVAMLLGSAALMPLATPAMAQGSASAPAADTVEDIIVTAQRRSESLQRVPISVTAVTPARIEELNLRSIDALQAVAPSLVFSKGQGFSQTFIRGVGTSFPAPGLEGSVATYVDGAYISRGIGTLFDLLDTQNVQVLNGPQGTLYGRNATGGAILLTTSEPTDRLEGYALAEYGRYNHVLGEAVLNIPISPTLSARFAGRYTQEDGYIHNLTLDKDAPAFKSYTVRGKLKWEPSSDFSAVLTVEQSRIKQGLLPHVNSVPAPLCLGCAITGEVPVRADDYVVRNDLVEKDNISKSTSVNLRLKLSSGIFNIESVTAYRNLFNDAVNDLDGTGVNLFNYYAYLGGKTFTQDLTVSTSSGTWVDATVGLSYLRDKGFFFPRLTGGAFAAVVPIAGDFPAAQNFVRTESVSAFAEVVLKPVDHLSITLGARYNYDDRQLRATENLAANLSFAGGVGPMAFRQGASFRSVTPRAVIAYDFGIVNAYASYNRGFKAGGFNTPVFAPVDAVRPETIDSFEAGLKFVSPDRRLRASIAGFYYLQDDLQVSVIDLTVGGTVIRNAASAKGRGVEADFSYTPVKGLEIFGGATYLHARFKSFPDASVNLVTPTGLVAGIEDLSGKPVPRAPDFAGYIGANVEQSVTPDWKVGLNAVARHSSSFDFYPGAGGQLRFDRQPAYTMVNVSGYVGPTNNSFQIGFYINNLTNAKIYNQKSTSAPFGVYEDIGPPRTYGARIKYSF